MCCVSLHQTQRRHRQSCPRLMYLCFLMTNKNKRSIYWSWSSTDDSACLIEMWCHTWSTVRCFCRITCKTRKHTQMISVMKTLRREHQHLTQSLQLLFITLKHCTGIQQYLYCGNLTIILNIAPSSNHRVKSFKGTKKNLFVQSN